MLTRLELTIDDQEWPKLHLAGKRVSTTGTPSAFDHKVQYDLAYNQFENDLHNQLRPAVNEIIERRKQQ